MIIVAINFYVENNCVSNTKIKNKYIVDVNINSRSNLEKRIYENNFFIIFFYYFA